MWMIAKKISPRYVWPSETLLACRVVRRKRVAMIVETTLTCATRCHSGAAALQQVMRRLLNRGVAGTWVFAIGKRLLMLM